MPSILTHYYFAKDSLEALKTPFTNNYEDVVYLGAQGSDPFYFYGNLFKKADKKLINDFATFIHHQDIYNLIICFLDSINEENKDFIFSYVYGLLNHYTLDRRLHPYIFYHSGLNLIDHQRFETNLDLALRAVRNEYIKPKKCIDTSNIDVATLSEIYYNYSTKYNLDLELDSFVVSINEMQKIQKVLYSPLGVKKAIFNLIAKNSSLGAMSMGKRSDEGYDYLNQANSLWSLPKMKMKMNLSVLDLLKVATKEFKEVNAILLKAYEGKPYQNELKNYIDDINHDGLKPHEEMKYFK